VQGHYFVVPVRQRPAYQTQRFELIDALVTEMAEPPTLREEHAMIATDPKRRKRKLRLGAGQLTELWMPLKKHGWARSLQELLPSRKDPAVETIPPSSHRD
jgi:hypothetical protein